MNLTIKKKEEYMSVDYNTLFEENSKMVYYCYNKLTPNEFIIRSQDDLLQEGFVALWNCILTYDPSRGEKLSSYAFPCIRNAMLRWIHYNSRFGSSIDQQLKIEDDGEPLYLKDVLSVETDFDSIEDNLQYVMQKYEKWLNKKHKSKDTIKLKLTRASIIITEYLNDSKTTVRKLQAKYGINRTIISAIIGEIRFVLKEDYPTLYNRTKKSPVKQVVNT